LTLDPIVYTAIALVVGLCVGSFLNVVVHRLPKMMEREWRAQCAELRGDAAPDENPPRYNLAVPRSACPQCGHTISAIENGRVRLGVERAKVLARALKCHPGVLVFPGWEAPNEEAA